MHNFRLKLFAALAFTGIVACGCVITRADEPVDLKPVAQVDYNRDIAPVLTKYCGACHAGEKPKAEIAIDKFTNAESIRAGKKSWEKIRQTLSDELMPPEGKPQPSPEERERIVRWLDNSILKIDCSQPRPGRVTIRRLNRAEYNNTIRDLMGISLRPADDFPSDDVGYGFDNIGDVLSLPPVLFERYLAAADRVVKAAIVSGDPDQAPVKQGPGKTLASSGEVAHEFEFPAAADYVLRARAYGDQAGPDPARMTAKFDGKELQTFDVTAASGNYENYDITLRVEPGKHTFSASFINDYYRPNDPDPKLKGDRNLHIEWIAVKGPIGVLPADLPESHKRLITCQPTKGDAAACARTILKPFASRAFRRPATDEEVERLVRLVQLAQSQGDRFERGIQVAVQAVLVSPQFLFRVELDPPTDAAAHRISDYELASRLSYFLWSSLPDEELFRHAQQGTLRTELETQVRRMLKDPKSNALVENFTGQWLQLRNLQTVTPDRKTFPEFDSLRDDMRIETEMFFAVMLHEDRSLLDVLDANFSFVNARLAKHYGIPDVKGDEFRRVALPADQRSGLLGHASILTVTSNPTRTSPVKRGKWVLENLLGTPPPPPPPNVPPLKEFRKEKPTGSLRQRLEQHRADPGCAACHSRMDPLGFGLENYNAIGQWRTKDGDFDVDAAGVLPSGQSFKNPAELMQVLKTKQDEFRRCLAGKLLTYAIGRGLEEYDQCTVDVICDRVKAQQDRMTALVLEIVKSDAFQQRMAKPKE